MNVFDRLLTLQLTWRDAVDILVAAVIIYSILALLRGTRAMQVSIGLMILGSNIPIFSAIPATVYGYAATVALAMIGPMPGTVINCPQLTLLRARSSISSVTLSMRASRYSQSSTMSPIILSIRGDSTSVRMARICGSCCRRKRGP